MLIYAFIRPANVEMLYEDALLANTKEALTRFSAPLVKMFKDIREWATTEGMGAVVSEFGTEICIEIPVTKVADLRLFVRSFEEESKTSVIVGVGNGTEDAFRALSFAEDKGNNFMFYSDDVEDSMDDMSKAEDQHFLHFSQLGLDQEEEGSEQAKDGEQQKSIKHKVIETLMMVKQLSPDIAKLKEINPEAYKAVKTLIDSLVMMAKIQKSEEESKEEEDLSEPEEESNKLDKDDSIPPGKVKKGRMKVAARDRASRKKTGEHWHRLTAGMALGPTGHAMSPHKAYNEE